MLGQSDAHIPVLLADFMTACAPISGRWVDGTLGAGGYSRALLDGGATRVIAIDCDPSALDLARDWAGDYGDRLVLARDSFSNLYDLAGAQDALPLDGVILDIGVSSMQLDTDARGFSFQNDGPLDMRMSQTGVSARDIVNKAPQDVLADILYLYGEERKSHRIAANIVRAREVAPIETTRALAKIIEDSLPRAKPTQKHPATRSFQALRIAVNDELGQLVAALLGAQDALGAGGILAVISFHSLEDRIVKRFIQTRGAAVQGNRHQPQVAPRSAKFEPISRKALRASDAECAMNPRARSAKLRLARRLPDADAGADTHTIHAPKTHDPRDSDLPLPVVDIKRWL